MIRLGKDQLRRLVGAAHRAHPREACGLLFSRPGNDIALRLVPTAPTWNTPVSFRIRASDVDRLRREQEAIGESLVGCFHSHLFIGARPTDHDRRGAARLGGLWLIYSVRADRIALFHWNGVDFEPRRLCLR